LPARCQRVEPAQGGDHLLAHPWSPVRRLSTDRRPRPGLAETGDAVVEGTFEEQGEAKADQFVAGAARGAAAGPVPRL
jgi:hypothetical protein